jgi:hypothetical protein
VFAQSNNTVFLKDQNLWPNHDSVINWEFPK